MIMSKKRRNGARIVGLAAAGIVPCLLANDANAAPSIYFDVNGTTAASGVAASGSYSWESALWSTSSAGTAATTSFVEGDFARFAAGTDAAAKNYTVTASSNHTIGGMDLQSNGGGTVTINGPGVLSIDPTGGPIQGFLVTSSSQILKINAKLSGTGGVENESSGSLDLFGNNDYSGGTVLGTSAGLNFNNNNSFGTNTITWGVAQQVLSNDGTSSPITLPNAMATRAASTLIYVGPAAAPVTFSNAWTLASGVSTLTIGNGTHLSSQITIAGAIGGSGGSLVVNGTTGKLIVTNSSNTYNGTTTVGGTSRLVLGAANAIASSSGVVLSGGTLDPDGLNQTMGATSTLGMTASSTIDYVAGASEVDFANSSAASWTGTLNLNNWDFSSTKLRFGTSTAGLTPAKLAEIEFNGDAGTLGTAQLDANGYVVVPEPTTVALLVLGAPLLLGNRRRRSR